MAQTFFVTLRKWSGSCLRLDSGLENEFNPCDPKSLNLMPENARKWPIFAIECVQNVRFVLKACNSARKSARRANNAQGGRLTCR
jgi:hypothetical protein